MESLERKCKRTTGILEMFFSSIFYYLLMENGGSFDIIFSVSSCICLPFSSVKFISGVQSPGIK